MSGGNADLEAMRRIVARPTRSPFDIFDDQTDVYSHLFALTGARHVMLRRTSKGLRAASDGAGKKAAVEYNVDTAKFNEARDWNKVNVLLQDLKTTCAKFDVQGIKMCGLNRRGSSIAEELAIAPMLRNCPGLTSLDLRNDRITDIEPLVAALAGCSGLTRLDLSGNRLHFREDTLRGLEQCKALRELNLYGNYLDDNDFRILTNAVDHLPALAALDLGRNVVEHPDQAESLITVLAGRCTGLARLSLRDNQMESGTVAGLCLALPRLTALGHLDLSRNDMGSRGLETLGRVLGECTSLESLDVSRCAILPRVDATYSFTDALPRCGRLRHLDLSFNSLGITLWTALVRVLARCTELEILKLCHCDVQTSWAELLVPELAACYALRELDLRMNVFTRLAQDVIAALRTAWAQVDGREPERLHL